mgnify:CR=1 FL=1
MASRGKPVALSPEHFAQVQAWERGGLTQSEIQRQLKTLGYEVNQSTVSRLLARIRAMAPVPKVDQGALLADLSEEDEDREIRQLANAGKRDGNAFAAQGWIRILWAERAIRHKAKQDKAGAQPEQPAAAQPELTPEEEAAMVAAQLGKRVYA